MIGIYKITSPSNKIYIGQSRNIERRFFDYINMGYPGQIRLYNSFKKYGPTTHKFEIIEECIFSELNNRERYWQEFYKVLGDNGLNCTYVNTDIKPKIYSDETKKLMSLRQIGNKNFLGKKHSEENKQIWREKATNRRHSDETKLKISKFKKGSTTKKKGTKMPDTFTSSRGRNVIDTKTGIIYKSIRKAALDLNIVYSVLVSRLSGNLINNTTIQYYKI